MCYHVLYCFSKPAQRCFAFFVPPPKVGSFAIIVDCIPIEQIGSMSYHPWHVRVIDADDVELVVRQLCSECPHLIEECSVEPLNASL